MKANDTQRLVRFIAAHDGCAVEQVLGAQFEVSSLCSFPDGSVRRVSETIDATLSAVRDWLGY